MVNKSLSCPNIHTSSHAFDLSQEKKTTLPDEHSRKSANESYQVFRICKERCKVLNVTIEKGIGITRGKIKDWRKKNNKCCISRKRQFLLWLPISVMKYFNLSTFSL